MHENADCFGDLNEQSRNPNPFRGWDECDK